VAMSELRKGFDPQEFGEFERKGIIAIILRNGLDGPLVYSLRHHAYQDAHKDEPSDVWGLLSETYLTEEEHERMFPENAVGSINVPPETSLAALSRCIYEELASEDGPAIMQHWKLLGAFAFVIRPDTVGFIHVFLDEAPDIMLPTGEIETMDGLVPEVAEAQFLEPRDLISRPLRNTYHIPTIFEESEFKKILQEHDIHF
jgi:hypothetical protein